MTKVFILSCFDPGFDQAFKIVMNNIIIVNIQHMTSYSTGDTRIQSNIKGADDELNQIRNIYFIVNQIMIFISIVQLLPDFGVYRNINIYIFCILYNNYGLNMVKRL